MSSYLSVEAPPKEGFRGSPPGQYELRASENGKPAVLSGHAATWDSWTEIDSAAEGHFLEKIRRGSFRKTIEESGKRVRVLFDHGRSTLGNMVLGKIRELREDATGLFYTVDLFDGVPDLLVNGLRNGEYGSSFRFKVVQEDFTLRPERSTYNPAGIPERVLTEVQLFELGPVAFPAYSTATAGLRSLSDEFMPRRPGPDWMPEDLKQATVPDWYLGDPPDWHLE